MLRRLESIKRLLREEWDPIGIRTAGGPEDEYDLYARRIFAMLSEGADIEAIARYLDRAESENMGLGLNAERNRTVARRAITLAKTEKKG